MKLKVKYRIDARTEVAVRGAEPGKPESRWVIQLGKHPDEAGSEFEAPPQLQLALPPVLAQLPVNAPMGSIVEVEFNLAP